MVRLTTCYETNSRLLIWQTVNRGPPFPTIQIVFLLRTKPRDYKTEYVVSSKYARHKTEDRLLGNMSVLVVTWNIWTTKLPLQNLKLWICCWNVRVLMRWDSKPFKVMGF